MISKLIRCLVAGIVLYLLYWAASLVVVALAAPEIVLAIVAVILILCFVLFILREFGIALP